MDSSHKWPTSFSQGVNIIYISLRQQVNLVRVPREYMRKSGSIHLCSMCEEIKTPLTDGWLDMSEED